MILAACGTPAVPVAPIVVPPTEVPTAAPLKPGDPLPRTETLYFNGQQCGSVICWNPYSSSCNNVMAISKQDNARVTMFETPYMYNMLDGKQYPLLADGVFAWDAGLTTITCRVSQSRIRVSRMEEPTEKLNNLAVLPISADLANP